MLDRLLAPMGLSRFIEAHQYQLAYHSVGSKERFSDLFQWNDVEDCLSNARLCDPSIRLIEGGRPESFGSVDALRDHLSEGKSVVINDLQEIDPVIRELCGALALELNTYVTANCYVSTSCEQGFPLHYDSHDVFIIQTEGVKTWRVHQPTEAWPVDDCRRGIHSCDTSPYLVADLKVGDVLYIPRGHWHEAIAKSPSMHLTVTVSSINGVNFLNDLFGRLADDIEILRKELPVGNIESLGGSQSDAALDRHLKELADAVIDVVSNPTLLKQQLLEYSLLNIPNAKDVLPPKPGALSADIVRDTKLLHQLTQKSLVRQQGESVVKIIAGGQVLLFDDIPMNVLETVFTGAQGFTGRSLLELSRSDETALSWDTLKPALLTLINRGLIKPDSL